MHCMDAFALDLPNFPNPVRRDYVRFLGSLLVSIIECGSCLLIDVALGR